jgi:hypothetical protein
MTETTAPAATDATNADTSTAASDAGKPNPHAGFQRRIDQLTREKHDLRRQLDSLRAPKQEPRQETSTEEKSLADFDYDEVAYRKHIREVAAEEARKAARGVLDESKQKEVQQSRAKTWKERSSEFAKQHPDFTEKVYADDVAISESMMEAITESEHGPAIAYYLAENPEEAERIANMSAAAAGRAIGRLESRFDKQETNEGEAKEQPKADPKPEIKQEPRVTKAPAPPPKLNETDSGSKKAWNDKTLSQEEFNKRRRAYINRR